MEEEYEEIYSYIDDRKAFIDVKEAAVLLGLHPNTIYKYIRMCKLPAKRIGKRWLINKKTFYFFMQQTTEI